ncbi:MAG: hypothetical protein VYE27_05785 [Pseudomonadota bacterium]|nr:hypothetical protein [Pseudomonadota bacterium]
MWKNFDKLGWTIFDYDRDMHCWAAAVKEGLNSSFNDIRDSDLRCGQTWFTGVNYLKNDGTGKFGGVPLTGASVNQIYSRFGEYYKKWDQAQISICFPGYPQPSEGESESVINYRTNKFSAHVDGILPIGRARRRFAREYYAFILGIPISKFNRHAAPLIVWEKSHLIMQDFLSRYYRNNLTIDKEAIDITDVFRIARAKIFDTCNKKIVWARIGESYLLHRLTLHGIHPWTPRGKAEKCGRIIAYFRPDLIDDKLWLSRQV